MKKLRNLMLVFLLLVAGTFITLGVLYRYYNSAVGNSSETIEIEIPEGTSGYGIGTILYSNGLIRSEKFYKVYFKLFRLDKVDEDKKLKSGLYNLSNNMTLEEIIKKIQEGSNYNPNEITIKFPEGINMRQIATIISENTNNSYDDVININNDKEYLNSLIEKYWFITDSILNKDIYYSLEGYLFPDTYRFTNKDVSVKEIFNKLIDQMDKKITPLKEKIEKSGFTSHEILTLASIAEKEVSNKFPEDRKNVINVFKNRLEKGMNLGSDVTTKYSLKIDEKKPLTTAQYNTVNAYNTRSTTMVGKLPAGPIAMVSMSSMEAAVSEKEGNNIFFISNIKTGETFYFEKESDFNKKKNELASINEGY